MVAAGDEMTFLVIDAVAGLIVVAAAAVGSEVVVDFVAFD